MKASGEATWTLDLWRAPAPPDKFDHRRERQLQPLARQEDFECCLLAEFGMSMFAISQFTGLSKRQVSYRLQQAGIKLSDFRNGRGPFAQMVFKNVGRLAAERLTRELRLKQVGPSAQPL